MAAKPYSTPGPYTSGLWYVVKGGTLALSTRSHLPRVGTGWQYYWLGTTTPEILSRFGDAQNAIGPTGSSWIPSVGSIQKAFQSGRFTVTGSTRTTLQSTAHSASELTSTGGSIFDDLVDAINSVVDFLKWIAWIFHPVNLLRAVEFVTGMILVGFGFHAVLQARQEDRRGGYRGSRNAAQRSAIGRTATRVAQDTPVGREVRVARGARAGRRSARRAQRYREYDTGYRRGRRATEKRQQRKGRGPQQ